MGLESSSRAGKISSPDAHVFYKTKYVDIFLVEENAGNFMTGSI